MGIVLPLDVEGFAVALLTKHRALPDVSRGDRARERSYPDAGQVRDILAAIVTVNGVVRHVRHYTTS